MIDKLEKQAGLSLFGRTQNSTINLGFTEKLLAQQIRQTQYFLYHWW